MGSPATATATAPGADYEMDPGHQYALGDPGKLEHFEAFESLNENLLAVSRLRPDDVCFVLRSGGQFTFAKVLSRQYGPDAHIELEVNEYGARKTIPLDKCAKYVRTMASMFQEDRERSSPQLNQPQSDPSTNLAHLQRRRRFQRSHSLHESLVTPSLIRQNSRSHVDLCANFQSDLDNWTPSPNLNESFRSELSLSNWTPSSNLNASFRSVLCHPMPKPVRNKRANQEWEIKPAEPSHSGSKMQPARRNSSISTHFAQEGPNRVSMNLLSDEESKLDEALNEGNSWDCAQEDDFKVLKSSGNIAEVEGLQLLSELSKLSS